MTNRPNHRISQRSGALAVLGTLLVLAGPSLVRAQGPMPLLPNHQIKRQRVPCCNENPIYKTYRYMYYGYYPTCWHRFPAGWGCGTKELANTSEAMAEVMESLKDIEPPSRMSEYYPEEGPVFGNGEEGTGTNEGAPPTDGTLPLPTEERSPFDLNPPPPGMPGPLGPPPGVDDGLGAPPPQALRGEDEAAGTTVARRTSRRPGDIDIEPLPSLEDLGTTGPALTPPDAGLPREAPADAGMSSNYVPANPTSATSPFPARAPRRRTLIGGMLDSARGLFRR